MFKQTTIDVMVALLLNGLSISRICLSYLATKVFLTAIKSISKIRNRCNSLKLFYISIREKRKIVT